MGDWTVAGIAGNKIFPDSGLFSGNEPDLDSFNIFLRKLSEEEPTLKEEIIEGLKNPVDIFETDEIPF